MKIQNYEKYKTINISNSKSFEKIYAKFYRSKQTVAKIDKNLTEKYTNYQLLLSNLQDRSLPKQKTIEYRIE